MTFRQGAALQRAQADPFSRGINMQGRGLPGAAQAAAAVQMAESQRRLRESIDEMNNSWVEVGTELTEVLQNAQGFLARGIGAVGRGASSAIQWGENLEEILPGGGGLADRRMREALANQNLQNRRQGVLASQIGSAGAQTSAGAGTAGEYGFFVRQQQRQEQRVLDLAAEQNLLLREINEKLSVQRSPEGDIIAIQGV
jgi:hypothetical protein